MISNASTQEVKFIDETFSSSEAQEIISAIIDKQINFYKLQHFSEWIRNHKADRCFCDQKINELKENKKELLEMISNSMKNKKQVRLNFLIEMDLEYESEMALQKSA